MPRHNTPDRYGSVARTLHWLTALLILAAFPLGVIANRRAHALDPGDGAALAEVATLFSLHKTLGVALFFVALLRILWALGQTGPGLPNGDRRAEALAAATVHWTLYGALVLVPLSGWVHHAAQPGFAPILWPLGQSLPFVPARADLAEAAASVHWLATKLLLAALVLHIGGALKHAVIDRDGTLARMLPGRGTPAPASARQPGHGAPIALALLLWAGVIGAGLAGQDNRTAQASIAPQTAEGGNWQVTSGTLGLEITQFGRAVGGSFGDWQASITYDPEAPGPVKGSVEVEIALASLSLGSVTDQAMGPEYFDTAAHPTARFIAEIRAEEGDLWAVGNLVLKGAALPLSLPFSLTIDGPRAEMTGTTRIDRRPFAIGPGIADPAQLGFEVTVTVALGAERID